MVVDIGKADHVSGHLTGGVETAKFLLRVNARYIQIQNPLPLLRGQTAHQVHELSLGLRLEALLQSGGVLPQRLSQFGPASLCALHFARVRPKRSDWGTHSQGLAVTIGHESTMRGDWNVAHAARISLALQKPLIQYLQVNDAPCNGANHQCQQSQHDAKTPRIERALKLHGATSLTAAASGMCIFNCSEAKVSIRL